MAFSSALLRASCLHCLNLCRTAIKCMSNLPENTVYGGPKPQNYNQRVTLTHLRQKHRLGEPVTVVTAYDYPSAVHVDKAGIDICLVGDSAAMVVHGYDTTLPISVEEMLVHCRAVARGAKRPLLVGDLPFGAYESSSRQAVDTAVRFLKEGGMDAIKLEGGSPSRITAAKAIVEAGIAVMGHVGLTPQAISAIGGFRPQGRDVASALKKWRHYLLGRKFEVHADHRGLKYLLEQQISTPDQQRLILKLLPFDFKILYKSGSSNQNADALSRYPHCADLLVVVIPQVTDFDDLYCQLLHDEYTASIITSLQADPKSVPHFTLVFDKLYYKNRLVIHAALTISQKLFTEAYSSPSSDHVGVLKTLKRLQQEFSGKVVTALEYTRTYMGGYLH